MAITRHHHHRPPQVHRIPQQKYIDLVRFIPAVSAFDRHVALALYDTDTSSPSLELHSFDQSDHSTSTLSHHSTYTPPSRITSLKSSLSQHQKPIVACSTRAGSVHVLALNPLNGEIEAVLEAREVHVGGGGSSCVDVVDGGVECVSVGEDGRVCVVGFGENGSELNVRRVFDSCGLVSYRAVKWASPSEFVTGGFGFGLQWWDQRKPGGSVAQLKGDWANRKDSGIVHSVDIHPSRKHTCVAGGSSGTIFAWDLRWQQQPIILSGIGMSEAAVQSPSESEVWEVQYDHYTKSSNMGSVSSSRILPVMFCSEDGILDVLEQGAEPIELLAEPCAINSFDIDRQNPSDVICSLEWESVAIVTRP